MQKSDMTDSRIAKRQDEETTSTVKVASEFGIRPPPMHLSWEFAQGVIPAKDKGLERARLARFHMRFILWARAEGFSLRHIAGELGCHRDTITKFLRKVRRDQGVLYECGVLERIEAGRNARAIRYFCRFCGATHREPLRAVDHTFYHILPDGGGVLVPSREWVARHPESPLARYGERSS